LKFRNITAKANSPRDSISKNYPGLFAMDVKRPHTIDKVVGRNIRTYRLLKGISQTDLGDKVGITFQQIQKYEKGVNRVGSSRLFLIAEALGVPVTDLFEGSQDAPSTAHRSSPYELLADPLSLRLALAFAAIPEAATRRSVVALVESIKANSKT